MTDSKDKKTTITLEPGQVAVVLGLEDGQISRQLFASPDVDAMLDHQHSDIPFNYFLASAFLVRLDQDEDFASDLADWYDEKLNREAGEAQYRSAHPIAFLDPKQVSAGWPTDAGCDSILWFGSGRGSWWANPLLSRAPRSGVTS